MCYTGFLGLLGMSKQNTVPKGTVWIIQPSMLALRLLFMIIQANILTLGALPWNVQASRQP